MGWPLWRSRRVPSRRSLTFLLVAALGVPLWTSAASASHSATCRADASVKPGQAMTWRALPSGGSGNYSYSWSSPSGSPEPVSGSTAVISKTYSSSGWREARVVVTDQQSGDTVTATCGMNVVPDPLPEPPTVNPVLWVPKGSIDAAAIVPQLDRVWRSIRAEYYFMYGKTFVLNPIRTIVSSKSEFDICGGDCADQGTSEDRENDLLMNVAWEDARATVGVVPYARGVLVMAWGSGGFAGAWSWDRALGGVGDWTIAGPAGLLVPHLEARFDTPAWVLDGLSQYRGPINCSLAHELNHLIGWDDPHDFCLGAPPTDYERQVVNGSPWMTVTPSDTVRPTVGFTPSTGQPVSGTATVGVEAADAGGMDAVVLLVDGLFHGVDTTPPYSFSIDTTRLNFGSRTLTAIAYDQAGNTNEATRPITVSNVVGSTSCSAQFPVGIFHACFFDGIGTAGPYLGTLLDAPSWRSDNAAIAIDHGFDSGVAFDQTETFTAVWRGQFDFPPENYRFRFDTDDGLRFFVNGSPVVDAWSDQIGYYEAIVPLNGRASLEVQWYENSGAERLRMAWGPTLNPPAGKFTISIDVDGRGGVTSNAIGISCGLELDCYESFPSGQTVTLTPTPRPGATFSGWSGHPDCTDGVVIVDTNKRCVATFTGGREKSAVVDFDGDGDSDIAVYRPGSGQWFVNGANPVATTWGIASDMPVPGDYDGDGKTDIAVYRPTNGAWYVNHSTGGVGVTTWGASTDVPVPGDYDGDGKTDIAVYRPSTGVWYVNRSTGGVGVTTWGVSTDYPVPADYDGDGKADIAVYRQSTGVWYVNRSTGGVGVTTWGVSTDVPVPADYDGDGKADIAVYRQSTGVWYVNRSTGGVGVTTWGTSDFPVPADYDADGKADIAVYRPSTGVWYINRSIGGVTVTTWGAVDDFPVILRPNDFTPPTVAWTAPVRDGERFDVSSGPVSLVASASDAVGVARVRFKRWDHPLQRWIDIATVNSAPWQASIDVATLNPEWNQINVEAWDFAGNISNSPYIWLYRTGSAT